MRHARRIAVLFGALALAAAAASPGQTPVPEPDAGAVLAAAGLGINVPLVGRLTGAGNTLYVSSVDVSNNAATDARVDFYLDGVDLSSSAIVSRVGSIGAGGIAAQGAGAPMRHRSNAHFDDFIDALVQAGVLDAATETHGFIGSVLFVFDGLSKSGQGAATVRFYNSFGGGTIGQALRGHEVSTGEPQALTATFRDSRGSSSGPKLYANLFINNTGLTPAGATASGNVVVRLQAYAGSSGAATGTPLDLTIGPGQTASVSDVLHRLNAAGEDTILVTATVTSGTAAIAGAAVEIDDTTKDGSVVDMGRGDF
jgi:hypothetical protein